MRKIFGYFLAHKIISSMVLIVLIGGGYWSYQKWFTPEEAVRYLTAKAEKGVLSSSISGTGQVEAESQVDIKAEASGKIVGVSTKVGQEVKTGQLLITLDPTDALKSVRDAETNLRSAQISYEKLVAPATELEILQAENSLLSSKESLRQAQDNLDKAYEDGFNTVSNAFLELPGLISDMEDMIFDNDFEKYQPNIDWYLNQGLSYDSDNQNKIRKYRQDVLDAYDIARINYNNNFEDYKNTSRDSSTSTISNLIWQTYETVKSLADTVKNMNNYVDYIQDAMSQAEYKVNIPALMSTHQSSLDTYTGKTNSHLSSLLQIKNSIESTKTSIESTSRAIAEKELSFINLKAGPDALDIETQKLSLQQKENLLLEAREKLADYYIRAPFDGVIASFSLKKGDTVSSGGAIATIINKQYTATISLNEVDAAKVKIGQKVIITFDAIEDLTLTGEVAEIDTLGTVSQGVVSYNVKIIFDIQDERFKSGMTVTTNIILSSKTDVLMVKTSAIKTQGNINYVEVLIDGVPQQKTITIGDSNDTMTEVLSGIDEGDEVVTQKITASSVTASQTNATTDNRSFGGDQGVMRMIRD